jgi:DUF4097 and DUF4098 domain-containing protein YvlB
MAKSRKQLIVGILVAIETIICVIVFALVAASGSAFPRARFLYAADTHAEATEVASFAPDGPAVLDLTNTYGDVQIVAADDDEFTIRAIKECWGQNEREAQAKLEALKVHMKMDNDTLRIRVEDPDVETVYLLAIAAYSSQVSFEIAAPRQTAVRVQTRNGNVSLKGTEGAVELASHYGSIRVEDVSGGVQVETNNGAVTVLRSGDSGATVNLTSHYGDITARKVIASEMTLDSNNGVFELEEVTIDGNLALKAHYGRIVLNSVQARALTARSQNGAITLRDGLLQGELDLYSHYGAVTVAGTEASAYRIETRNGAIELDGGRGPLQLTSHYGDITVWRARDVTLDLTTSNGKVSFEGSLSANADHQAKSDYGDVSLRLPPDVALFLDARTEHGRIQCRFDVLTGGDGEEKDGRSSGDELRGMIHGGGPMLVVESRNGDVIIQSLSSP